MGIAITILDIFIGLVKKGKSTGNPWFLPSNIGLSCKFSHHPILWHIVPTFLGGCYEKTWTNYEWMWWNSTYFMNTRRHKNFWISCESVIKNWGKIPYEINIHPNKENGCCQIWPRTKLGRMDITGFCYDLLWFLWLENVIWRTIWRRYDGDGEIEIWIE